MPGPDGVSSCACGEAVAVRRWARCRRRSIRDFSDHNFPCVKGDRRRDGPERVCACVYVPMGNSETRQLGARRLNDEPKIPHRAAGRSLSLSTPENESTSSSNSSHASAAAPKREVPNEPVPGLTAWAICTLQSTGARRWILFLCDRSIFHHNNLP